MKLWVSRVGGDDKVWSPTCCSRLITDSRRIKKKKMSFGFSPKTADSSGQASDSPVSVR